MIADLIKVLAARGVSLDTIVAAVEALEAGETRAMERPASTAADRARAYRARRASRTVTPNVTECDADRGAAVTPSRDARDAAGQSPLPSSSPAPLQKPFPTTPPIAPPSSLPASSEAEPAKAAEPSPKSTDKADAARGERAGVTRRLPAGFPDAELVAEERAKIELAGADLDADVLAEDFRLWWTASGKTKANWRATFQGWVRREIAKAPKRKGVLAVLGAAPPKPKPKDQAAEWRARLAGFQRDRHWDEDAWGPKPTREACRCPPKILSEAGYTPLGELL